MLACKSLTDLEGQLEEQQLKGLKTEALLCLPLRDTRTLQGCGMNVPVSGAGYLTTVISKGGSWGHPLLHKTQAIATATVCMPGLDGTFLLLETLHTLVEGSG